MIIGVHTLIYSKDAEKDRAFFRDVLGFKSVDAGADDRSSADGWLIFALPPAEMGVHPTEGDESHVLYLMCDDVAKTIEELKSKGVSCSDVHDAGWGLLTSISLPGGGKLGMYQPRHAMAIEVDLLNANSK